MKVNCRSILFLLLLLVKRRFEQSATVVEFLRVILLLPALAPLVACAADS